MKIAMRVFATLALFASAALFEGMLNPIATLGAGKMAGGQFEASDQAYVVSQYGMAFFSHLGVPSILIVGGLALIWWAPLKKVWVSITTAALVLIALMVPQARAYYDKTDYSEVYFVMPNESAFYVPDVGDNKSSQAKFGSLQYFEENKIAAKRFVIPHVKLENSGLWSNFYVPAGRLVIVDRTPYSREWVDASDRGSSAKKQGFPCQSKEGMDVTVGMSIGVSVMEENAAKFLYRFGVTPPEGNRTDPVVTFTSVLHSRSLADVMDHVGRNKVQALVCNQVSARNLDDVNGQAVGVMSSVKGDAEAYFKELGITLDYLGWADTMTFASDVQQAINDRYTAEKVRPVMDVLVTKTALEVSKKWNGAVPSSLSGLWMFPKDIYESILGWFSTPAPKAAAK